MRDEIVAAARSYIGTKWRHRGRNRRGVDCIGLVYLAYKDSGVYAEDKSGYGREPWNDELRQGLRERFGDPTDEPQPGDIALFEMRNEPPRHIGILGNYRHGGLSIIHADNRNGVVEQGLENTKNLILVEVYKCPV